MSCFILQLKCIKNLADKDRSYGKVTGKTRYVTFDFFGAGLFLNDLFMFTLVYLFSNLRGFYL